MRILGMYKTSDHRAIPSKTMIALNRIKRERGSALTNYKNAILKEENGGDTNSMLLLA